MCLGFLGLRERIVAFLKEPKVSKEMLLILLYSILKTIFFNAVKLNLTDHFLD